MFLKSYHVICLRTLDFKSSSLKKRFSTNGPCPCCPPSRIIWHSFFFHWHGFSLHSQSKSYLVSRCRKTCSASMHLNLSVWNFGQNLLLSLCLCFQNPWVIFITMIWQGKRPSNYRRKNSDFSHSNHTSRLL